MSAEVLLVFEDARSRRRDSASLLSRRLELAYGEVSVLLFCFVPNHPLLWYSRSPRTVWLGVSVLPKTRMPLASHPWTTDESMSVAIPENRQRTAFPSP